jgi:Zinc finger protein
MAEALAELYWRARVDANDVEFVLAPPRKNHAPTQAIIKSDFLGNHTMWILDFDCCKNISLDEAGVEQAVVAFYKNDPFYPRPGCEDRRDHALWEMFRARFLEASGNILGTKSPGASLASLWVAMVERRVATRLQNTAAPT